MSKRFKAILFTVVMLVFLVVSVMGWHWTDTAKTPFWWNFWIVAAILSVFGFIGGILWYNKTRQKN